MLKRRLFLMMMGWVMMAISAAPADDEQQDISRQLEPSLVFVQSTLYRFETIYPWRQGSVQKRNGEGCAIGPYEVLTPAYNVTDAIEVTVRRHGQNELISAKVKVVDYDVNLCILELDRDELDEPLTPLRFHKIGEKGVDVGIYWLSGDNEVKSGRGYIDRFDIRESVTSHVDFLNFVIGNVSQPAGNGHLFVQGDKPIGIGCWYAKNISQSGIIPANVINRFLDSARSQPDDYQGVPIPGFAVNELIDPSMRDYLKMPEDMKSGVYVKDVYSIGTGSAELQKNDVVLAIDQNEIDAYGKFLNRRFKRISYEHLIMSHNVGDTIEFVVWRDGARRRLDVKARHFSVEDMLVPYHEFDRQSDYAVVGGLVFRELTRKYLESWGSGFAGKGDSHLNHYYLEKSFKPASGEEPRERIVILSHVLPADINLGYQDLSLVVVKTCNDREVKNFREFLEAMQHPQNGFHVIELENDNPTVVIPVEQLPAANLEISQLYGIEQMQHVD